MKRLSTFLTSIHLISSLALGSTSGSSPWDPMREIGRRSEDAVLQKLIRSQTLPAVAQRQNLGHLLRRDRLLCDAQLRGAHVPARCFTVLHEETRLGLLAPDTLKKEQEWLERVCLERVKAVQNRNLLRKALTEDDLPVRCREAVLARVSDLIYMDEERKPAELFRQRFDRAE